MHTTLGFKVVQTYKERSTRGQIGQREKICLVRTGRWRYRDVSVNSESQGVRGGESLERWYGGQTVAQKTEVRGIGELAFRGQKKRGETRPREHQVMQLSLVTNGSFKLGLLPFKWEKKPLSCKIKKKKKNSNKQTIRKDNAERTLRKKNGCIQVNETVQFTILILKLHGILKSVGFFFVFFFWF